MRRFTRNIMTGMVALGLLAGCTTDQQGKPIVSNEAIGTGVGAVAGAGMGALLGKGKGKVVGILAGGAIGGFLGNRIGAWVDEEDQKRAAAAAQEAAEKNKAVQFKAEKQDVQLAFEPVRSFRQGGRDCREMKTSVWFEGKKEDAYKIVCKGDDGTWKEA